MADSKSIKRLAMFEAQLSTCRIGCSSLPCIGVVIATPAARISAAARSSRTTHASLRLDRYRRNLRTQSLHDPVDYKLHDLGDWALNHTRATPSFCS